MAREGSERTGPTPEEPQQPGPPPGTAEEDRKTAQRDEEQESEQLGLTDEERRGYEELKREVFGPRCC